ncbi:hypothetical protein LTR62_005060 [Meristemomyces frigidus]|uniref:Transcription initiation factor IIF subunit beta n=1 Tax=Meristemomyces frigidus TaxID=1508187 RepID=A0AAN7TNA9_9PEZI|nr:hypothetical protein LTR62_005060 [Meristemomyces frigidus]
MADIKPEIKIDPGDSKADLKDIAAYEDDYDLAFPDPTAQAWLVKVPEDLWKAWAEVYNDPNIPDGTTVEVGNLRIIYADPNDANGKEKIQIRLQQHNPSYQKITKKYDLNVTASDYSNVCVFSEKNLPGHNKHQKSLARNANALSRPDFKRPSGIPSKDQRYGGNRFAGSRSRSAIPKQTSLAPRIQHEALATPVLDADYEAKFAAQWAEHVAPKEQTVYFDGIDRTGHAGLSRNLGNFATFGLSAHPAATTGRKTNNKAGRSGIAFGAGKPKRSKDKAVRMERGALIDALQACFRRYKYWGMKSLRNELHQPEAWIRENLEQFAVMVKSGDFSMNWTLREDMRAIVEDGGEGESGGDGPREEMAVVESGSEGEFGGDGQELDTGADEEDDDEDGDAGEFEDVKME